MLGSQRLLFYFELSLLPILEPVITPLKIFWIVYEYNREFLHALKTISIIFLELDLYFGPYAKLDLYFGPYVTLL